VKGIGTGRFPVFDWDIIAFWGKALAAEKTRQHKTRRGAGQPSQVYFPPERDVDG
jgi:hypothetical protein